MQMHMHAATLSNSKNGLMTISNGQINNDWPAGILQDKGKQ